MPLTAAVVPPVCDRARHLFGQGIAPALRSTVGLCEQPFMI
jgi:hypothetical protein